MTRDDLDPKLLEALVCPQTREPLKFDAEKHEMICAKARLAYPVRDGLPLLVRDEARDLGPKE